MEANYCTTKNRTFTVKQLKDILIVTVKNNHDRLTFLAIKPENP